MKIYIALHPSMRGYTDFAAVARTREEAEQHLRDIGKQGRVDEKEMPDGTTEVFIAMREIDDDLVFQGVFVDYDSAKVAATDRGHVQRSAV